MWLPEQHKMFQAGLKDLCLFSEARMRLRFLLAVAAVCSCDTCAVSFEPGTSSTDWDQEPIAQVSVRDPESQTSQLSQPDLPVPSAD